MMMMRHVSTIIFAAAAGIFSSTTVQAAGSSIRRPQQELRKLQESSSSTGAGSIDFWTAFAKMTDDNLVVWPLPNSNADHIQATFGSRSVYSRPHDFHRGVDIYGVTGDPVVSSYDGVVVKLTNYSGNQGIIVEPQFPFDVDFHGQTIRKWYTHYTHLHEQLVAKGDVVVAGGQIGTVGSTGASTPHLHHEVRLGTRCTLWYALKYTTSYCNTLGVDPHVHPLLTYPKTTMTGLSHIAVISEKCVTATMDGAIRVSAADDSPDVNRYEIYIMNTKDGSTRKSHVLDYNLRIGFDASSTTALDTQDVTKPYLQPLDFGYQTTPKWEMDLVVPSSWVEFKAGQEEFLVKIYNIWNDPPTIFTFGLGQEW